MTKDEAFKRGMELLRSNISAQQWFELQPEITAIKEALAQPEQEPVATVTSETGNPDVTMSWWHEPALPVETKLYTTPPQRTWVGLTDEEVKNLCLSVGTEPIEVRLIEAKLKEKNT
jgi:hypothetical protein